MSFRARCRLRVSYDLKMKERYKIDDSYIFILWPGDDNSLKFII